MLKRGALENRIFKMKNPSLSFFCPLCSTERSIANHHSLKARHFVQISILTAFTTLVSYPLMGARALVSFFIYWAALDLFRRLHFRKEVPCPHCGFDASWYKKDVKVARRLVEEFWAKKSEHETNPVQVPPSNNTNTQSIDSLAP